MPNKTKLNLNDLTVQSFQTSEKEIKGGTINTGDRACDQNSAAPRCSELCVKW